MNNRDKRAEIMQATLELIAEKAGVAAGTIYCYFENKDVLINELHQTLEERIVAVVQAGFPFKKPVRDRFLYVIRGLFRYFVDHPLHYRYLEQYYHSPYGITLQRERLFGEPGKQAVLMDIFKEGLDRQILKALPVVVLFSLSMGPLASLMRDHTAGFVGLDEELIEQAAEACWDAIKK
jgi:AcrR family transcriptional regulator